MSYDLRPYQSKAIDDLYSWFDTHPEGHPIVEACVASGKSLLIAEFCRRALADFAGTRILMAVHVKELVQQNYDKLLAVWPEAPVGILSASLNSKNTTASIIYGSIQTIANNINDLGVINLMVVDECHLVNPNGSGQYRKTMAALTERNPEFRVIGFTGTPFRGDGVWLTQGKEPIFTHITSRIRIPEMMKQGYLSPITTAKTETKADTSDVLIDHKTGDYRLDQLGDVLADPEYVKNAVSESIELAVGRKKIMVFTANIALCEFTAQHYEEAGETVGFVHSQMKTQQRDETIAAFERGDIRFLVNVAILTTGFDVPSIDCIVLMRPTASPVLYIQIAGRGLRLSKETGKTDCLWLDFTQTTDSQGPIDEIKGRQRREKKTKPAPFKSCPECGHECGTATLVCGECGYEWPVRELSLALSGAEIMSTEKRPEWVSVKRMYASMHRKEGKPPTIRLSYANGLMTIASVYLSIHEDAALFPKRKSWELLKKHGIREIYAEGLDDALLHEWLKSLPWSGIKQPTHILVKKTDKNYLEIIDYKFEEESKIESA